MLQTAVLMFQINQANFGRAAAEVPIIRSAHQEKGRSESWVTRIITKSLQGLNMCRIIEP